MNSFNLHAHRFTKLSAIIGVLTMTGCASDAWNSDPGSDRFFQQIEKACSQNALGCRSVRDRANNDSYFIDETTKLYLGNLSRESYTSSIDAFMPGDNDAALECIFRQLP